MHPNHATNWNRENVYKDFGFDQFLSINDFQGADTLRGMVTDQATYDKILELLDQNADPQFIFDVTMQNHSGYDTGLLPADKQMHLNIDTTDLDAKTVEDGTLSDVDEYVSCIEQSDQALRYFLNALNKLDRKVVVVFWGDHQPFFPSKFNDKWFTDEDDATHQERLWQTDYIIWANYDVAGCDQTSEVDDLSTNYLSTQLMQLIGAPLSDYQKAHMTLRESLPAINSVGYEDASLRWALSSNVTGDDDASRLPPSTRGLRQDAVLRDVPRRQERVYRALPDRGQRDRPQPGTGYNQDQIATRLNWFVCPAARNVRFPARTVLLARRAH